MKKIITIAAIAMALVGCGRLTYEEVQAQSKYCTDNGLKVDVLKNGYDAAVLVRCVDSNGARYVPKGAQ